MRMSLKLIHLKKEYISAVLQLTERRLNVEFVCFPLKVPMSLSCVTMSSKGLPILLKTCVVFEGTWC